MSGVYINQLPKILYGVFAYYVLMNISLMQILLVVSNSPEKTLDSIIQGFTSDVWMKTLLKKCINGDLNMKEMEKEFN